MSTQGDILHCPRCGAALSARLDRDGCGIARCACGEIPVSQHVWFTSADEMRDRLLAALRARNRRRARELVLGKHARRLQLIEAAGVRPTFRMFVRHRLLGGIVERINLRPWLQKLGRAPASLGAAAEWNVYMRHRFTSPPMLSIVSLLGLLRGRQGLVLDAPCGMGHLAFMISKLVEPVRIVCMDLSPAFAYSARRFFVPQLGATVTHDMNHPLPLADRSVGAIFCSDAFHYVDQRAALAREFLRILHDDGVCVLAHVHNSLVDTAYAGNPLTPAEYRRLFEGAAVRIFPESYRIDAYIRNKPLDLTRHFSNEELKSHRVLDVIAARSPDAFGVVPPSRDAMIDSARNPRPSGLYRMMRRSKEFVFELHIPRSLEHEYAALEEMLPPIVSVPANLATPVNGRWQFDNQRELLEKHVLMDLPEDY